MYHMTKASVRDLRYEFKKIERLLLQGEEIQITKRKRVIARLVPESAEAVKKMPDFAAGCALSSATRCWRLAAPT
jgi:antitoxin (DNA-binding transcriptional repressor) of toxin-antitoxin stability system